MKTLLFALLALFGLAIVPSLAEEEEDLAHRLKASDQISLSVYQENDLSKTVTIASTGEATFPLIGPLMVKGLTIKEATELITNSFMDGYLRDPKVSLTLIRIAPESITITGSVNSPRTINLPSNSVLDIRSAISSAGGLSSIADPDQIFLRRGTAVTQYSMDILLANKETPVTLEDGDVIEVFANVFANAQVSIYGYVRSTGSVRFPVSGKLDLGTLIELAGGLSPGADPDGITIERDSKTYRSKGLTQTLLQPDDIVLVPSNEFLGTTVTMTGQINRPGKIPFALDGKMSLLDAISSAGGPGRLGDQRKITVTRPIEGQPDQVFKLNADKMEKGEVPIFFLKPNDTVAIPKRFF